MSAIYRGPSESLVLSESGSRHLVSVRGSVELLLADVRGLESKYPVSGMGVDCDLALSSSIFFGRTFGQ